MAYPRSLQRDGLGLLRLILAFASGLVACADPLAFEDGNARPARPIAGAGVNQVPPDVAPSVSTTPALVLPRPIVPLDTSISPLCAVVPKECEPDDTTGGHCADESGSDSPSAGSAPSRQACRIRLTLREHSGAPILACVPAGNRVSGESCASSAQCAPGYDCVGSPGICRRYCCDHTNSPCGDRFFCDIQPAVDFAALSLTVPVCSPVHDCRLLASHLGAKACAANETCTVIDPRGATSCIRTGLANAGDSCEGANCAADHVCVGHPGYRKCYQLCDASVPSSARCSEGEACETNPALFKSANIGTCSASI